MWRSHVACECVCDRAAFGVWIVSHMNESCHVWRGHVTYESCHAWMSHVTYEEVMSHMSHVTHAACMWNMTPSNLAWLTHMWHDSLLRDMTHSCVTWLTPVWHVSRMCDMTLLCMTWLFCYGVALVSRIYKIIGLFCQRALLKRRYSAEETYNFIDPTDRSHPTVKSTQSTSSYVGWSSKILKIQRH